ncbi:FHA domain-containing protein [Saccharophagus degradans]|uniref:FHA domain-containing protein n=1 Tax=Saccharophagus degradans TaxID=86304 RepID=A0AAW7X3K2_9GAMM|nr:FHA domain-containing protein [Saccharophagus degradans]MDO6421538.1 FHA domain-containing protein [Saccharophagus degradans]MDO6608648.1 FHA domain-containing protein [Saccharophagus degradans]
MIIQSIDRSGHVIAIQKYVGTRVDIGRGFSNQHIINDPYADGKHVRVEYDHQHEVFFVSDLESANGTTILRGKQIINVNAHPTPLQAGDTLVVGKTHMRIVTEHTPVPPPLRFSKFEETYRLLGQWWVFIIASIAVLSLNAWSIYIEAPFSETLTKQYAEGIYVVLVALGFAGVWSIAAKLQHLEVKFLLYANLALLAESIFMLLDLSEWVIKFNMAWLWLSGYTPELVAMAVLFVGLYICAYQATRLRLRGRIIFASIAPALIVLTTTMKLLDKDDFKSRPDYKMIVVAPSWQLRGSVTEDKFLEATKKVYKEAAPVEKKMSGAKKENLVEEGDSEVGGGASSAVLRGG